MYTNVEMLFLRLTFAISFSLVLSAAADKDRRCPQVNLFKNVGAKSK